MEVLSHRMIRLLYNIPNLRGGKVNFMQTSAVTVIFFFAPVHRPAQGMPGLE
jgi:hypothetical protein